MEDRHSKLAVFTGIDGAKFRRSVTPGDQLRIEVGVVSFRPRFGKMEGKAYVDGKLACEATLTCMIVPRVQEIEAAKRKQEPKAEADVRGNPGIGDRVSIHPSAVLPQGAQVPVSARYRAVLHSRAGGGAGRGAALSFRMWCRRPHARSDAQCFYPFCSVGVAPQDLK